MASSHSMPVIRPPARTVVLVGPGGGGDIEAVAGAVAARGDELVVLATGWPLTSAQQDVIHEAMRAAADLRLAFEAHLLSTEAELEDHLVAGDRVVSVVAAAPVAWPAEAADERPVATFA
jgi:hypothetical protein